MSEKRIRVLVIDDSSLHRQAFSMVLSSDPEIEVVATAQNGKEGVKKALALKPDVITMDIQMPVMNGVKAISKIMEAMPTPIIVISVMDTKTIAETLSMGAMDFISITQDIDEVAKSLIEKVKVSSRIKAIRRTKPIKRSEQKETITSEEPFKVIAIGSSTGGPAALEVFLAGLPSDLPAAVLIAQHISKGFISGLISYLQQQCSLEIQLAKPYSMVRPGKVIIAPDDAHFKISRNGRVQITSEEDENSFYIPSIDVLMTSVAATFADRAVGIIMTGMGNDGADGIKAIKQAGGFTIAQNKETSAIFGMNKVAIETGYVDEVLPLGSISEEILNLLKTVNCT
jgi:two-component system, chemotaxis family, protein-glutamate methylesterase/glutaminase